MGRGIGVKSGDARQSSYLFRRISVAIQRFNSALLHDTLAVDPTNLYLPAFGVSFLLF